MGFFQRMCQRNDYHEEWKVSDLLKFAPFQLITFVLTLFSRKKKIFAVPSCFYEQCQFAC